MTFVPVECKRFILEYCIDLNQKHSVSFLLNFFLVCQDFADQKHNLIVTILNRHLILQRTYINFNEKSNSLQVKIKEYSLFYQNYKINRQLGLSCKLSMEEALLIDHNLHQPKYTSQSNDRFNNLISIKNHFFSKTHFRNTV